MKRPTQFLFYYFLFSVCLIGAGFSLWAGNTTVLIIWVVILLLLFLFFRRSRTIDKNILKANLKDANVTPKNLE